MPPTSPSPSLPPSMSAVPSDDPIVSIKVVFRKVANTRHYHAFLLASTVAGRQQIIGGYVEGLKLIVEAGVLLKESAVGAGAGAGAGKNWQLFNTGISEDKAPSVWAKMEAKANELKNTPISYDTLDRDALDAMNSNSMAHDPELTHCNAVMTTVLQATTDQQAIGYIQQWNTRRKKTAAVAVAAGVTVVAAALAVAVAVAFAAVAAVVAAVAAAVVAAAVVAAAAAVVAVVVAAGGAAAHLFTVAAVVAAAAAVVAGAVAAGVAAGVGDGFGFAAAIVASATAVVAVVAGATAGGDGVDFIITVFLAAAVVAVAGAGAGAGVVAGAVVAPVTKSDIPGIGNMLMAKA